MPKPRIKPPATLEPICASDTHERLVHAYGKSFADAARLLARDVPHPPDVVAYPASEDDVAAILDWADGVGAAVILCLPFISSGVHQERRPVRRHW